jgi:predicted nuclease of predicted toxin-antitoxin system
VNFFLDHDIPERVAEVLKLEGHSVTMLRHALPIETCDEEVLKFALRHELILVTCNRNDFLSLAKSQKHHGIVVLIRRRTRITECVAMLRLVRQATLSGLVENINFA